MGKEGRTKRMEFDNWSPQSVRGLDTELLIMELGANMDEEGTFNLFLMDDTVTAPQFDEEYFQHLVDCPEYHCGNVVALLASGDRVRALALMLENQTAFDEAFEQAEAMDNHTAFDAAMDEDDELAD